jgi:tRNA A-37 threonylcarbamoyl transferase component Bud32
MPALNLRLRARISVYGAVNASRPSMSNVCGQCGVENLEIDVNCVGCGAALMSTGVQRLVGTKVMEHYEIIDVLGQGGMSVVYKARHELTAQEVALKVLPRELAAHAQVKSRFVEEARALAAMDHPNIVHLYTFGEADGCLMLVMQFVQGPTFERLILENGRLPWEQAVRISIDVLRALEYAHHQGIIHRDMKPSNVLVRADSGAATVMDFGIAKMTNSTRLTATGQTMGTVRYMSPEQVRGKAVDVTTDIYSLGATLYEAVVGDTPFDGETHFEIMTKHLSEPPRPPSSFGIELPKALEQLILTSLAKRPEDRFPSAYLVRTSLERILAGDPISVPAPAPGGAAEAVARVAAEDTAEEGDQGTALVPFERKPRSAGLLFMLGSLVVAAGAGVLFVTRAGTAISQQPVPANQFGSTDTSVAVTADAAVVHPPPPFLLDGMKIAVDERYQADQLRVMSVNAADPQPVADAVRAARSRFLAFLDRRGAAQGVSVRSLTVVIVPEHVICDRQLYETAQAYTGCENRESHYRVRERTLYIVDSPRLLSVNLPSEIALQMCVDADSEACAAAFSEFERELARAQSGRKQSDKPSRRRPKRRSTP